ncbi:EpsG family protein [Cetobacterium somerae]|uniref:EpsG family protein n=1 Tax=Cetobacterium somerae TaxID=188913 RepID=UPI00224FD66C|nr:EpsG family protein [Cetobacterium somerae]MCX3068151.1 EpsG family protein [Cetobacterium somerae]
MGAYLVILNTYFIASLINKKKYIFYFFTFFIFVGLRMETGYDWPVYNTYFTTNLKENFSNFEFGYVLWNRLLQNFGTTEIILNIGNILLFLGLLFIILKKTVKNIGLFFYIYVFMDMLILNMAIIRQGISILFFYLMVIYFDKKKRYIYYLLSISFHKSSLIYLPLLYIVKKKYNQKIIYILFMIGIFIFFIRIPYIFNILELLSKFQIFEKLKYYLTVDKPILSLYQIFYAIKNIFLLIILEIIKSDKSKKNCMYYNIALINLLCFFYLYEVPTLYQRVENITSIGFIIYICNSFENISKIKKIIFYAITFCYFNIMFIYFLTRPLSVVYVPYQNYLYTKKSSGWERTKKLYKELNSLFKEEMFKDI